MLLLLSVAVSCCEAGSAGLYTVAVPLPLPVWVLKEQVLGGSRDVDVVSGHGISKSNVHKLALGAINLQHMHASSC